MKKIVIALMFGSLVWAACKNTPASKCGICPAILVVAPYINVKIVDKTSGADLFLSPGSPYKFSDLKVSSSVDGSEVNLSVDSMDKANRFIRVLAAQNQTLKFKLADLTADSIKVTLKLDSPKCCSYPHIHQVSLNNTVVCSACGYGPTVTIKK